MTDNITRMLLSWDGALLRNVLDVAMSLHALPAVPRRR